MNIINQSRKSILKVSIIEKAICIVMKRYKQANDIHNSDLVFDIYLLFQEDKFFNIKTRNSLF